VALSAVGTLTASLASIPSPSSGRIEIGPVNLTAYGVLVALGITAGIVLAQRRWAARGGDPAVVGQVAMWAVIAGILGARLIWVVPRLERFEGRWLAVLFIWEGGLAFFGGLLAGGIAGVVAARRAGVDVTRFADAVIPAIPLGQAIGRWGNYVNQELFGRPTALPWGLEIDPHRRPERFADAATFHPTFLYESLWNLVTVVVLLRVDARLRLRPGQLVALYAVLYGVGRFGFELLRVDTDFRLLGISRNGLTALALVAAGTAALVVLRRRAGTRSSIGEESSGDSKV
jgi:prolipoprotein diacylglyceryl transferase